MRSRCQQSEEKIQFCSKTFGLIEKPIESTVFTLNFNLDIHEFKLACFKDDVLLAKFIIYYVYFNNNYYYNNYVIIKCSIQV